VPIRLSHVAAFLAAAAMLWPVSVLAATTLAGTTPLGHTAESATSQLSLSTTASNAVITRAQALAAVEAVLGLTASTSATSATYSDVSSSSSAYGAVEAAVAAGLLKGWVGLSGSFDPNAPMSRIDLAILATNAMALAPKTTANAYSQLADLAQTGSDVGYADTMMYEGVVPPLDGSRYDGSGAVTGETLAVALYRMWWYVDVPVSASITPTTLTTSTGSQDALTVTATNRLGKPVPATNLARYLPGYNLVGQGANGGQVTGDVFTAKNAGSYTVSVTLTGPLLPKAKAVTASTTVTVSPPPPPPTAPTAVTGADATGSVTVSWTPGTGSTGYVILEAPAGSSTFTAVSATDGGEPGGQATSSAITGLTPGDSYQFEVDATGPGGSAISSPSGVVTFGVATPSGVTASEVSGGIEVSWDAANGATGYEVWEASGGSTTYTEVGSADGGGSLAGSTTSATVTGLTGGTAYTFEVEALDAHGNTATSGATASTTYVTAPTSVTATDALGGVTVSWSGDTSPTGYQILASTGGVYSDVGTAATAGATTQLVTGLTQGDAYTFEVEALGGGTGSTTSVATSPSVTYGVLAPGTVTASEVPGGIQVSWDALGNVASYEMFEAVPGLLNYVTVAQSPFSSSTTSTTLTDLAPGTTYTFEVRGTDPAGNLGAVTVTPSVTYVTAPTGVAATEVSGGLKVEWSGDTSPTGYQVLASTGSGYTDVGSQQASGVTSETITGLTGGASYTFEVEALGGGTADTTSTPSSSVPFGSSAPAGVAAAETSGGIKVTWNTMTGVNGYDVLEEGPGATSYSQVATVTGATTASVVVTVAEGSLNVGDTYSFEVQAVDALGNAGALSTSSSATYGATATAAYSPQTNASATIVVNSISTGNTNASLTIGIPNIATTITEIFVEDTSSGTTLVNLLPTQNEAGASAVADYLANAINGATTGVVATATTNTDGSASLTIAASGAESGAEGNNVLVVIDAITGTLVSQHLSGGASATPDTVTVGTQTYTAVSSSPSSTEYDSQASLESAIAAANTGLTVSVVNGKIQLTAKTPGSAGDFTVSTNNTTDVSVSTTNGSDAQATLTFSQPMNAASDTISGVSLSGSDTLGTGDSGTWSNSNKTYTITLGTGATVTAGDTLDLSGWVDANGGPSVSSVKIPVPN